MYIVSPRSRAIVAAIFIVPLLIWTSLTFNNGKIVASEPLTATVASVIKAEGTSSDEHYAVTLKLSDGQKIELTFRLPVPKVGEAIPLIKQTFKDKRIEYRFDRENWQYSQ
jgi:hypothetical protein